MTFTFARVIALIGLLGILLAGVIGRAQAAEPRTCSPQVRLLARSYGSPDDIVPDHKRLLFGDLANGVLASERNGTVKVLASGLRTPEGIVVQKRNRAVVVEQGLNRLDVINLATGSRHVLIDMANQTGLEGVDGIHPATNGGIYVPDSPHGTLYLLDSHQRLHLLARGMQRPVDAIRFRRGIAVADENAHAVWKVRNGHLHRLATVNVPDDLVVFHGKLVTDSLGDDDVLEVWPSFKVLASGFNQPQGLAVLNSRTLVVTASNTNGIYAVTNVVSCL